MLSFKFRKFAWALVLVQLLAPLAASAQYRYQIPVAKLAVNTNTTVSATPDALDFGGLLLGQSIDKMVTLKNLGPAKATWTVSPVLAGSNAFTFLGTDCPATLPVNQECSVAVRFTAATQAAQQATLTFATQFWSKDVVLSGSGDGSSFLGISGLSLTTRQGEAASGTVTVSNSSAGPLTLTQTTFASDGALGLASNGCPANTVLSAGGSCLLGVTVAGGATNNAPVAAGTYTGTVSVVVNGQTVQGSVTGSVTARDTLAMAGVSVSDMNYSQACYNAYKANYGGQASQYYCTAGWFSYVNGYGGCNACGKYLDDVQPSAWSLNFGSVEANTTTTQQVALLNGKATPVTVSNVYTTGTSYSADSACTNTTLASSEQCLSNVSFTPNNVGSLPGSLVIEANTEGSPFYIQLSGTGLATDHQIGAFTLPAKTTSDAPFVVTPPTSASAGAWSYASSDTSIATVSGNTITIKGVAGTSTITATQAAYGAYSSKSVSTNLVVSPGAPVYGSWAALTAAASASPLPLSPPTSNSTGAWSYTSSDTSVATVTGSTVTLVGAGTTTITGSQAATANFLAGSATTTLTVTATPTSTALSTWSFEGTAGAAANGADFGSATVTGAIQYVANGRAGNAGSFNSAYITAVNAGYQLGESEFAIEWWQKGSSAWAEFTFGTPGTYAPLVFSSYGVYASFTGGTWGPSISGVPTPADTTNWHHVAIVRDAGTLRLYLDGVNKGNSPAGASLMSTPGNQLVFGRYAANFTGQIDQVRVHVGTTPYRGTGSFTPSTNLQ